MPDAVPAWSDPALEAAIWSDLKLMVANLNILANKIEGDVREAALIVRSGKFEVMRKCDQWPGFETLAAAADDARVALSLATEELQRRHAEYTRRAAE